MEADKRRELEVLLNTFNDDSLETTPLCAAAENGNTGLVVVLLDKLGADINFKDTLGETPLMKASDGGHLPVVETLLAAGADVDLTNRHRFTALHVAAGAGYAEIVDVLLKKGAETDARAIAGGTPLMQAVYRDRLSVVKTLLAAKAGVNVTDAQGTTALYLAARDGQKEVMLALLHGGADTNLGSTTPLMAAADKDDCSIVETLLAAGADVNIRSTSGWRSGCTALHFAAFRHNVAHVSLLLRWGADENTLEKNDKTPADFNDKLEPRSQAERDRVERVRLLLARAPADRAWRRRGWLVMLRSRTLKAGGSGSGDGGDGGAAGARSVKQRAGSGEETNEAGSEKGSVDLSAAVAQLGLIEEGVFRNVVGFL